MDNIIRYNRQTLKSVKNWINRTDWETPQSIFNYGLPDSIYHLINLPIDENITEVDIICKYCDGKFEVKFPTEFNTQVPLRIRNKGFKSNQVGDMFIKMNVKYSRG